MIGPAPKDEDAQLGQRRRVREKGVTAASRLELLLGVVPKRLWGRRREIDLRGECLEEVSASALRAELIGAPAAVVVEDLAPASELGALPSFGTHLLRAVLQIPSDPDDIEAAVIRPRLVFVAREERMSFQVRERREQVHHVAPLPRGMRDCADPPDPPSVGQTSADRVLPLEGSTVPLPCQKRIKRASAEFEGTNTRGHLFSDERHANPLVDSCRSRTMAQEHLLNLFFRQGKSFRSGLWCLNEGAEHKPTRLPVSLRWRGANGGTCSVLAIGM